MKKKPSKPYWEMTTAELREATKEFDKPLKRDTFRPLTPALKAQLARAKRKLPGRPPVGNGAERVLITLERGLLKQSDVYAKKHGLSRSQLISRGLQMIVSAA